MHKRTSLDRKEKSPSPSLNRDILDYWISPKVHNSEENSKTMNIKPQYLHGRQYHSQTRRRWNTALPMFQKDMVKNRSLPRIFRTYRFQNLQDKYLNPPERVGEKDAHTNTYLE
jgi:hypothetical protein